MLTPFYSNENDITLGRIQRELEKLFARGIPEWNDRQSPDLDRKLSGIVTRKKNPVNTVSQFDAFVKEIYDKYAGQYALEWIASCAFHKMVNKQSADAFMALCLEHRRVTKEENEKNPDVDFWIDGQVPIDLKVTTYPTHLNPGELKLKEVLNRDSAIKLIRWYYKHQGIHRWNWQNRLFIVCYDADKGNHLELKVDFDRMRGIITNYFDNFQIDRLHRVSQLDVNGKVRDTNYYGRPVQSVALSDIILNYREKPFDLNTRKFDPITGAEQLGLF